MDDVAKREENGFSMDEKLMNIRYTGIHLDLLSCIVCSAAKGSETRRHYSKLMSFAIIINDTAVLKRKNNWLNLFVWGWVHFLGDPNLIWIRFRCVTFFFCLLALHVSCVFFLFLVAMPGASAREKYTFSSSTEDIWNNELVVLCSHESAFHIPFVSTKWLNQKKQISQDNRA